MLLYIISYIMLAYLMLFAALFNAVYLDNAFFAIDFFKCLLFSCFVLDYSHVLCLFQILFSIMQCFQSVGFRNFMFTPFFYERAIVLSG